jgi:methionine-rich copper-binding protein CopC
VKVLMDKYLEPGDYSAVWNSIDDDGNAVAGGVYLYRVTMGDKTSTRKMILMK